MANKEICIIGGGTVFHLRPHLALCAPAYGTVAKRLAEVCRRHPLGKALDTQLYLTRMAGGDAGCPETNDDVARLLTALTRDPATKIVFLTAALCDYTGRIEGCAGKSLPRLQTQVQTAPVVYLAPAEKLASRIRRNRKDIFAVAFKTTTGATEDEQYLAGLNLLKSSSVNLVLANDVRTRVNMIITPEEARYATGKPRNEVLEELVDMALLRSQLTFTRSTVVDGDPIAWSDPRVPAALRTVVNHCVAGGAYKSFRGATVGHFACRLGENEFLTSIRKSNFNDLDQTGLVRVVTDGPDSVIAYGAKPSVGGQSQRIVFTDHPQYDCIVHFHCPKRAGSLVPSVSQREYECGSHECGANVSRGLQRFGELSAVYLEEHGPNIVFHHSIDPQVVISFIEENFDLSQKTGGYVSLGQILRTPDTLETLQQLVPPEASHACDV